MSETATKCLVDQSDTLSIESRRSNADISSLEDSLFAPLITAAGLSRQLQDAENQAVSDGMSRLSIGSTNSNQTTATYYRPSPKKSQPVQKLQKFPSETERPTLANLYQTRNKWHKKGTSNLSLPDTNETYSAPSLSGSSSHEGVFIVESPSDKSVTTDKFRKPTAAAPKSSRQTAMEAEIRQLKEMLTIERAKRKQTEALLFQFTKANKSSNSSKTSTPRLSSSTSSRNSASFASPASVNSSRQESFRSGEETPKANENFYQSTSLFTPPAPISTGHDHSTQTRAKMLPPMPPRQQHRQKNSTKPSAWFVPAYTVSKLCKSRSHNGSTSSSTSTRVDLATVPTLQECLMSRKAKFVRNSKFRQHQIQTASLIRHEADQQLRLLARDIAEGKQTAPPPYAINALDATKRAIRAFNIEEMTRETRKKYLKLPEIQQRKRTLERQMEYKTNRIQAEMFKQQLLYKLSLRNGKNMSSG